MPNNGPPEAEFAELARQALAGRVARDVAHEINNLLVGVMGVAQEALRAATAVEPRRALEDIATSSERIAELVRAFQELFRETNAGGPVSADVAEALDRALFLCRKRIARQGVEVKRAYGGLPRVSADIGFLEQVFIELLLNALDEMPTGRVLTLVAEQAGQFVRVTVACGENAWEGAPPGERADADSVLEPPDRPDPAGSGEPSDEPAGARPARELGLAVARATVRRCGGDLIAHGTLGGAVRFTVLLPVETQSTEP